MVGACVSFTLTLKEQVEVLPAASVATETTVVSPTGNIEPLAGVDTTDTEGEQLSTAPTVKLTAAPHVPEALLATISEGHVITAGCVSLTVTVKLHVNPAVEVTFTVVTPTGKKEPEAGVAVTVPQPAVLVGAGKFTIAPHWFVVLLTTTFDGHVNVQAI